MHYLVNGGCLRAGIMILEEHEMRRVLTRGQGGPCCLEAVTLATPPTVLQTSEAATHIYNTWGMPTSLFQSVSSLFPKNLSRLSSAHHIGGAQCTIRLIFCPRYKYYYLYYNLLCWFDHDPIVFSVPWFEIAFLAVLKFCPVEKLIFGHFWNSKKWILVKKNFTFHEFFGQDFLKFSGSSLQRTFDEKFLLFSFFNSMMMRIKVDTHTYDTTLLARVGNCY